MKVSKTNPIHWLYLVVFGLWVTCAILIRPFRSSAKPYQVVLYGHTLSGNLLAIYRYVRHHKTDEIAVTYLCLDPHEYQRVLSEGGNVILATRPACARLLGRADAIITDHGLHSMKPLLFLSDLKFFDVWHGIPFKGFDPDDFRTQHRYDEVWVPSPFLKDLYVDRFGFKPDRVFPTGYPRTDRLVCRHEDVLSIRRGLGLPADDGHKVVLFAPTWRQDDQGRNIFPFGLSADEFNHALSTLAQDTGATVAIRTHLNIPLDPARQTPRPGIIHLSQRKFPDTEALLLATNILICDWSSIAFDFLLLDRPTIFLDVPPPFKKGFSLNPEHRFGVVAHDEEQLYHYLRIWLQNPENYRLQLGDHSLAIRRHLYDGYADGLASSRCYQRLLHKLRQQRD